MIPTSQENPLLRLDSLEKRLHRTESSLRFHKLGWTLIAALVIFLLGSYRFGALEAQSAQPQKLRLRELDIVDDKGRERIVIAAPLPEVIVDGKVGHRIREVSAAIQFKSPNGNEQGGIALSDDGSMIVGIDDERGHERAHLYYIPKRGSGVFLTGENGVQTVSLLLPNAGGRSSLKMTDEAGQAIVTIPSNK